jgi:hypothetical protein
MQLKLFKNMVFLKAAGWPSGEYPDVIPGVGMVMILFHKPKA